jgi:hypothetical protein
MGRLFISYKSEDTMIVRSVVDTLRANNIAVWFAEYFVLSREYEQFVRSLHSNLAAALASCDAALLFASSRWVRSQHCLFEGRAAIDKFRREGANVVRISFPNVEVDPRVLPGIESIPSIPLGSDDATTEVISDIARRIILQLSGREPAIPQIRDYPRDHVFFSKDGYYGYLQIPHANQARSIGQIMESLDPPESSEWSCPIGDLRLDAYIELEPQTSILSPWELVDRDQRASDLIDDQATYTCLRRAAAKWLANRDLEEIGLHLFWHRQLDISSDLSSDDPSKSALGRTLGKMAITCRTRRTEEIVEISRIYILLLVDPWSRAVGQAVLRISFAHSATSLPVSESTFFSLAPIADQIALSIRYLGKEQVSLEFRALSVLVSAGVTFGLLELVAPSWPPMLKMAVAAAVGISTALNWTPKPSGSRLDSRSLPSLRYIYKSKRSNFEITLPPGWTFTDTLWSWLYQRIGDAEVMIRPIGRHFPTLAINAGAVHGNPGQSPDSEIRNSAEAARMYVERKGYKLLELNMHPIEDVKSFEIVYTIPNAKLGDTTFLKVECIHDGRLVLLQGSTDSADRDLLGMRAVTRSLRFLAKPNDNVG